MESIVGKSFMKETGKKFKSEWNMGRNLCKKLVNKLKGVREELGITGKEPKKVLMDGTRKEETD